MNTQQGRTTEFTADQKQEIEAGKRAGVNVSAYAKPEFFAIQMEQIRLGLEAGLPVERYASLDYDWFQMEEIRLGLESGIDIGKYASPSVPFDIMRQIRLGLEDGIDLSSGKAMSSGMLKELRKAAKSKIDISGYIRQGYDEEQLNEIRHALEKGVDIAPYLLLAHRGMAIREIRIGLEEQLNVLLYAKAELSWQQMREIRIGLERRLDVSAYMNTFYSWQQMREIRLGLEQNLPVEKYNSLMYTAKDMERRRLELIGVIEEETEEIITEAREYPGFSLFVSEDRMEAFIVLNEKERKIDQTLMLEAFKQNGIERGIDYSAVEEVSKGMAQSEMVVVAKGSEPVNGEDGWYEFFFETDVKNKPKLMEDGSVDYHNIKWFEIVQKGQRVAYYHRAKSGEPGHRVTGEIIPAMKGKEMKTLKGRGFVLMPDQVTYLAEVDGKIELKGDELEIANVLVLDDVTIAMGNISFNGSVYVRGSVGNGVVIKAEKDILVDGFIESAMLDAGGDIIIRSGSNAGGKGYLRAKNDVYGNFFEHAYITAGRDILANYCLNSVLYAGNHIEISGRNGMLAGGSAYAAERIVACDIGNEACVATNIRLGRHDGFLEEEMRLRENQVKVDHELSLLRNAFTEFERKYTPESRNVNPIYLKIEDAIYTKELEMGELLKKREQHEEEKKRYEKATAIASGTLYAGVRVEINGVVWNAKQIESVCIRKQGERISIYSIKAFR